MCDMLLGAIFLGSLPNNDVKFSYLKFSQQGELTAINLPFFALIRKPLICANQDKVHFAYFVQCDQHGIIMEHFT